jgi:hypothetical protein
MYELLQDISQRPEPFSRYTAMELWTRPHRAFVYQKELLSLDRYVTGEPLKVDGDFIGVIANAS